MFANRQFRFNQEKTVIATVAMLLCYSMSYWQWTRYVEKIDYFGQVDRQAARGMVDFSIDGEDWSQAVHAQVRARGTFDHDQEMILTNRSKDGVAGVKVVTPLRLSDGGAVLVSRGFLDYERYAKEEGPDHRVKGEVVVEGNLRPSKQKSFFLSPPAAAPTPEGAAKRWLRLEIEAMAPTLAYAVAPVYLEQTNQGEGEPLYDPRSVSSPGLHLNYVIQWASFGTFAIGLAFFLQFRPKRKVAETKDFQPHEAAGKS